MKVKITFKEISKYLNINETKFPKYISPLINLANQYAQGTRPKVVGQMSELIKEFKGKTLKEWENWYKEKYPKAIENSTEKILNKIKELKDALNKIDRKLVEKWVKDLVIIKTFIGLKFHEVILKKVAEIKNTTYKLPTPEEEAKGIDGYIDKTPVSIKPHTYNIKKSLPEKIGVKIIYYKKVKDGIEVDFSKF